MENIINKINKYKFKLLSLEGQFGGAAANGLAGSGDHLRAAVVAATRQRNTTELPALRRCGLHQHIGTAARAGRQRQIRKAADGLSRAHQCG